MDTRPKLELPEEICLPDGRRFRIRDLINPRIKRTNYNLRTRSREPIGRPVPDYNDRRTVKYTIEDRIWQCQNKPERLAERYGITAKRAQAMQYQARYIMAKLGIDTDQKD